MVSIQCLNSKRSTYRNGKARRHAVKIVGVLAHGHDLGHNGILGPLNAEYLGELLEILSRGLTNREDGVAEPAHAEAAQLLVEELYAKLGGKEGNVFNNGQTHTPLLVLGKLDDGRKKGLGEKLNANNYRRQHTLCLKRMETHHC